MGKNFDLPVHHPSWYLAVDDLCSHLLSVGGEASERTSIARRVADGVHRSRRKVLVVSVTGFWSDLTLGKNTMTSDFHPARVGDLLESRDHQNVILEFGKVSPDFLNSFIATLFDSLLSSVYQESTRLKLLIVMDGVYDYILNSIGWNCPSVYYMERAVRECRKWGVGILMSAEKISRLTDVLMANFWTVIHLGSQNPEEVMAAPVHFKGEASKLKDMKSGEALALSANYYYAEPFRLRLPKD